MRRLFGMLAAAGLLVIGAGHADAVEPQYQWLNRGTNLCMEATTPQHINPVAVGAPCRDDPRQRWILHNQGDFNWVFESVGLPGRCLVNTSNADAYHYDAGLGPCDRTWTLMHWRMNGLSNGWHLQTRELGGRCLRTRAPNARLTGGNCDPADLGSVWTVIN